MLPDRVSNSGPESGALPIALCNPACQAWGTAYIKHILEQYDTLNINYVYILYTKIEKIKCCEYFVYEEKICRNHHQRKVKL